MTESVLGMGIKKGLNMRDKAEKRRNDYLKAKKKERIFREKSYDKDESARGFFGKLRKGKVPFKFNPSDIENDISLEKTYTKSNQIKVDEMNDQEKEFNHRGKDYEKWHGDYYFDKYDDNDFSEWR